MSLNLIPHSAIFFFILNVLERWLLLEQLLYVHSTTDNLFTSVIDVMVLKDMRNICVILYIRSSVSIILLCNFIKRIPLLKPLQYSPVIATCKCVFEEKYLCCLICQNKRLVGLVRRLDIDGLEIIINSGFCDPGKQVIPTIAQQNHTPMILETGDILQLNNICYVSIHFSYLYVLRIHAHDGTVLCLPAFVACKGVVVTSPTTQDS